MCKRKEKVRLSEPAANVGKSPHNLAMEATDAVEFLHTSGVNFILPGRRLHQFAFLNVPIFTECYSSAT